MHARWMKQRIDFGIGAVIKHAAAAEYWRRHLANDTQSEWAARPKRSLKFCEIQIHLSAS
jgi:hypothetical protein